MAELIAIAFGIYLFASFGLPLLYMVGAALINLVREVLKMRR